MESCLALEFHTILANKAATSALSYSQPVEPCKVHESNNSGKSWFHCNRSHYSQNVEKKLKMVFAHPGCTLTCANYCVQLLHWRIIAFLYLLQSPYNMYHLLWKLQLYFLFVVTYVYCVICPELHWVVPVMIKSKKTGLLLERICPHHQTPESHQVCLSTIEEGGMEKGRYRSNLGLIKNEQWLQKLKGSALIKRGERFCWPLPLLKKALLVLLEKSGLKAWHCWD